ncbi:uncharacterized protein LOC127868179 isoform X2 [Dreissena polymorpha]|uniref:uncharacterized protein LOC127868179 isoform X2 n=1 Tax=Dreissena polymorpha TaxID=45954 RepID=UPI00226447CB|nr:uncharacterized protein LOC127868179 isoform X2 [Dreissena polymorpha]
MVAKQKKTRGPYKKRQTPVVQAKGFAPTRGRPMKVEVDLFMECEEESLSIAQIKAFKEAEAEHEKANNLIKLARGTGNTLVPSNSPNTFNIVPLKPLPLNPPGQVIASSYTHVSEAVTSGNQGIQILTSNQGPQNAVSVPVSPVEQPSRGLPPPRPAQFLNKQQPPANRALAPAPISPSPDIILVGETPPLVTNTSLGSPVSLATSMLNVTQFLTSHSILAKQGFKLVTVPSNQPIRNQWAIRPVLMSSQSQTMHSGTAMPVSIVTQPGARMPYTVPGTSMSHVRTILSKPTEPGSKRALSDTTSSAQPPAKKKTVNPEKDEDFTHVEDKTVFFKSKEGKLVPLEEFYYGTLEGDANFTEEKGEFRFKCWYCSKMLYNNVRAMQHIQGHITSSKQQNIDLSDLTQCKHCFKQFDTPFEMQTHVEKVHLSNKVLMCRICEQDFTTSRLLANHMRLSHFPSEMPYLCQLCSFRSSMYSDVVDHFKKKHDSSCNLLCLYCLRTFDVKFVSQGWGQTQTYYGHLLKHQSKTSNKKCPLCRLTFFNAQDVKNHRKSCHVMMNREASGFSPGGKQDTSARQKKSNLKSLNAPSVSKILDYGDVKFPTETQTSKCVECKMAMASADHYKKFIHCSMCRFATSCSVAYANHMLGFHSGQMSSLNLNIPWERPAQQALYCACGFSTRYGNKLANHLVFCTKAVCYTSKPDTMEDSDDTATAMKDAEKSSDSSVLGVLGLVQKRPEFMSRPGPKSKSRALQKTRPESRFANVINLTKEVLLSKEKILNVIDITEDKTEDKDKPNMKMTDTNDVPNVGESKFKGDVDKEQMEDKKAVFAVDLAKNAIEGRDKKTEINEVKNEDNLKQEYKTENKTESAEIQGIIKLIPAEENVTTDHDEEGQTKEMKLDLKEVIDLAEDDTDHQLETENKTEDHKEARQAEQLINVTEKEEQTKKIKRDLKEVIDLAEDDTDHQLETENKTEDHKEARQAEQLINVTDKDGVDKEEDAVNETTEKMEVSIEESRKDVDNLNNEESVSLITVDDVAEESADDIVDEMAEDVSMKESEAPDANVVAREPEPVIKESAEKPEESQIEEISEMQTDEKIDVLESDEKTEVQIDVLESDEKTEEEVGKKSDQSEHLSLSEPIKVQSEVGDKESQSKEKSLSDSNKNNSDEHRDSRNSAERSHDRRSSEHGSGRRSEESRGSYDDRQRSRDSSERSRDRHNSNQDHRRSEERYRHDNRSHESNSSSSNDRDRSHERDRDYNRNRDYHQGDGRYGDSRHGDNRFGGGNRGGYSHGDNRDYHGNQGQRGQHGYQDNRGSYSRGGYNRGGHNPNYRGSYQGGYY